MTESFQRRTLTLGKLKRLIERARRDMEPATADQLDVVDFDWYHPHHFRSEHIALLEMFTRRYRDSLKETLEALFDEMLTVTTEPPSQHFAAMLVTEATSEDSNQYYLPITTENRNDCGFISFSTETAAILVALMLRESAKAEEPGRKLSSLEDSILMDVTLAIVQCLSDAFHDSNGSKLAATTDFVKADWPVSFDGLEDLIEFPCRVESPMGEFRFSLYLLSAIVDPVAGIDLPLKIDKGSAQLRNTIMARLSEVPVSVTARLCSCRIELDDIMSIKEGDVLLTGSKISRPADVLINGHPCFKAYPAKSFAKLAIVVTQPESE